VICAGPLAEGTVLHLPPESPILVSTTFQLPVTLAFGHWPAGVLVPPHANIIEAAIIETAIVFILFVSSLLWSWLNYGTDESRLRELKLVAG
jgi:hypothetical protein